MKLAIAGLVLMCAASASAQALFVRIIDRQDHDTDYTYVVPGHWFSNSTTNVNCGGRYRLPIMIDPITHFVNRSRTVFLSVRAV